jgi:hypothetical protein
VLDAFVGESSCAAARAAGAWRELARPPPATRSSRATRAAEARVEELRALVEDTEGSSRARRTSCAPSASACAT